MADEELHAEVTLGFRQFSAAVEAAVQASGKLEAGVGKNLDQTAQRSKLAQAEISKALKVLTTDFRETFEKSAKAAQSLNFADVRDQLSKFATVGANSFREVITSGGDFQESMLRINTIAGLTDGQLASLAETLRTTGQAIGTSTTPVQAAAAEYEILSSGFTETADSTKVLNEALRLAAGGQAETADSSKLLTGILNAYGDGAEKAALRSDQLFQTVNLGVTTIPELARSLGLVTSTAAVAGVSFEEVAAAVATLTLKGNTTSSSVEGLRGAINALVTPSKQAQKAFAELGITVNASTLKQKGFAATIQEINDKAQGNIGILGQIYEGQVALGAALGLAANGGDKYRKSLDGITEASGKTDKAIEQVNKGLNENARQASAAFEALKTSTASAVLPIATTGIKAITGFIRAVDGLPAPVKVAGLAVGGLVTGLLGLGAILAGAAAIGPAIVGSLTAMAGRIGPLISAVFKYGNSFRFLDAAQKAVIGTGTVVQAGNAALTGSMLTATLGAQGLAIGLGVVAAGLIALTALVVAYTNEMEKANQAEDNLRDADNLTAKGVKGIKNNIQSADLLGKSPEELSKQGIVKEQFTQEILDEQNIKAKALEEKTPEGDRRADDSRKRITQLRAAQQEFIRYQNQAAEAEKARAEAAARAAEWDQKSKEEAKERFNEAKQEIEASDASHRVKLNQLLEIRKAVELNSKEEIAFNKLVDRERKAATKEEAADKKRVFEESVKQHVQEIENSKDSESEKAKSLQSLIRQYRLVGDIRRSIEDQVLAHEKKAAEQREKLVERERSQREKAAEGRIDRADLATTQLERVGERGVDVSQAVLNQQKEKLKAEQEKIDIETQRELDKIRKDSGQGPAGSRPDPRFQSESERNAGADLNSLDGVSSKLEADAIRNGEERKKRLAEQYEDAASEISRKGVEQRLQNEQALLEGASTNARRRIAILKEEAEAGKNVGYLQRQAIEESLKLQEKQILVEAELRKRQTEDPRRIAQIEQDAQGQILEARRAARKELEETNAALERQKKLSAVDLNLTGGPYSFEQFLKENNNLFGEMDQAQGKKGKLGGKGYDPFNTANIRDAVLDAPGQKPNDLTGQPLGQLDQKTQNVRVALDLTLRDGEGKPKKYDINSTTFAGRNSKEELDARNSYPAGGL